MGASHALPLLSSLSPSSRASAIPAVLPAANAAISPEIDPQASLGVVQQWIYNYRAKPDYAHVPAAVRVLFHAQTFKEPENAGIYLGFIAGAIGSNPAKAEQLVSSLFPVPPEDEWVIVRAIAYSGLPDWRNLLRKIEPKMPGRQVMIDAYLAGTLPTLTDIPLEETKPGMMDKLRSTFTHNPFAKEEKKIDTKITFANSQDLLDTLWGYYFATGSHVPIQRIISMLPWSKSRDTVDKLTVGSMARYTLASYAVRDQGLREYLRGELAAGADAGQGAAGRSDPSRRHRATRRRPQGCACRGRRTQDQGLGQPAQPRFLGPGRRRRGGARLRFGRGTWPGRGRHSLRDRRLGVAGPACRSGKKTSNERRYGHGLQGVAIVGMTSR